VSEGTLNEKIARAEEIGRGKNKLAFLEILLEMYHAGEISLDEVREQVDTFIFAGIFVDVLNGNEVCKIYFKFSFLAYVFYLL
jgi:hypothetical protein